MPTGYTAAVQDGEITEFPQFALRCARAFGALVMMRDDPSDAEVPATLPPEHEYSEKQLAKARERGLELLAMTGEQISAANAIDRYGRIDQAVERELRRTQHAERYARMLDAVSAWTPPTEDHESLKAFMVQQLTESLQHDCSDMGEYYPTDALTDRQWYLRELERVQRDIEYHSKSLQEAKDRHAGRQEWLDQLRASLS